MGKVEETIKSEIVRLTRREMRKVTVPMGRDVRMLKATVSHLRKTVTSLERFAAHRESEMLSERKLEVAPEEIKKARFSPRLIRRLRERLGITQKDMATLAGVTVGAIFQWEKGIFEPRGDKKGVLIALRKLGRRDVKKLLEQKSQQAQPRKTPVRKRAKRRRSRRK